MTLRAFIKANRAELDACIKRAGYHGKLNDDDRRQWVLNDESLYQWAQDAGVPV